MMANVDILDDELLCKQICHSNLIDTLFKSCHKDSFNVGTAKIVPYTNEPKSMLFYSKPI